MEIIFLGETDSLREAFAKVAPHHDTFGAEWPSIQCAAEEAEDRFFASESQEDAAVYLRDWKAAMSMLCDLRNGEGVESDFPKSWFYRAWFCLVIVDALFRGNAASRGANIRPKISDEAEAYLDINTRNDIEKAASGRFWATPFIRGVAGNRERGAAPLGS